MCLVETATALLCIFITVAVQGGGGRDIRPATAALLNTGRRGVLFSMFSFIFFGSCGTSSVVAAIIYLCVCVRVVFCACVCVCVCVCVCKADG